MGISEGTIIAAGTSRYEVAAILFGDAQSQNAVINRTVNYIIVIFNLGLSLDC